MKKLIIFLSFSGLFTGSLIGEVGLSSIPVLSSAGSPAEAALGRGGLIMGTNIYNVSSNPAVVGLQDYPEFYGSYETLPFDYTSQMAGFTKPITFGTIGVTTRFMGSPKLTVIDENFNESSTSASDFVGSALYAFHFSDFSFGVQGSFIQSNLADFTARTVALDAGAIMYFDVPTLFSRGKNQNLGIGFAMKNLSPGIKYGAVKTALPLVYSGGIYYNLTNFSVFEWNLELFVQKFHSTDLSLGAAIEMEIMRYLVVRAGYANVSFDGTGETRTVLTGGGSVLVHMFGYVYDFAYAVQPNSFNSLQHTIGLRVQFGGGDRYPFGISVSDKARKLSAVKGEAEDLSYLSPEDRAVLLNTRRSIVQFQQQNGRYPRDLNELLLFLNKYHIYEIPNPSKGRFRYNKRTGKLFIRE